MKLKTLMAAALMSTALSTAATAGTNGPVRSVTLSSGGLAEIVREARVEEAGHIRIEVPLDQVDDVLKSLVVRDPAGTVKGMTLAGPEMLEETFRPLPFSPEDLGELPSLLSALQGTPVTVTSGGKTVTGQVLGVEYRDDADGRRMPLLTVLDGEGGIVTLWLSSDSAATIDDADMRKKVADATAAAGRGKTGGSRAISIEVGDGGVRDIDISYVVAAPIWKTAYRVVVGTDGTARLQAWAVLENASGEDWDDVNISLSSGSPVTLKQRLHQRYWRDRAEVPVDTSAPDVPAADSGDLERSQVARGKAGAAMGFMAPAAPAMDTAVASAAGIPMRAESFSMSAAADAGTASEGDVTATFELAGLHDLANGDTMSVPIIDKTVEAEMVSVYRHGSGSRHPVAAVMLDNSTGVSLPEGILTVYDEASGYVGDSKLLGLPAGDSRMASFASDRKVTVVQDAAPDQRIADVKVIDGMIHATVKHRDVTTYTVTGALDAPRTVVIEHPRREGWSFASDSGSGETATHHRLEVKVEAGGEATTTAVHEMLRNETYGLVDADPHMLLNWAESAYDGHVAERLGKLAEARREQVTAQYELRRVEEEIRLAEAEQERIRQNLGAVPVNSDLHADYLSMLQGQEERLSGLTERRRDAREAAEGHAGQVRDIIRTF